jgi:hypothetical protein
MSFMKKNCYNCIFFNFGKIENIAGEIHYCSNPLMKNIFTNIKSMAKNNYRKRSKKCFTNSQGDT